jgi:hypothetical protein
MFRKPWICGQAVSGCASVISDDGWFAARGSGSKRDRVLEGGLRDRPLEQPRREHVDVVAAEQGPGILHQPGCPHHQVPVGWIHLDEDVDVAADVRGPARDGAEQLRTGRGVLVEERLELVAARADELAQGETAAALFVRRKDCFDGFAEDPRYAEGQWQGRVEAPLFYGDDCLA